MISRMTEPPSLSSSSSTSPTSSTSKSSSPPFRFPPRRTICCTYSCIISLSLLYSLPHVICLNSDLCLHHTLSLPSISSPSSPAACVYSDDRSIETRGCSLGHSKDFSCSRYPPLVGDVPSSYSSCNASYLLLPCRDGTRGYMRVGRGDHHQGGLCRVDGGGVGHEAAASIQQSSCNDGCMSEAEFEKECENKFIKCKSTLSLSTSQKQFGWDSSLSRDGRSRHVLLKKPAQVKFPSSLRQTTDGPDYPPEPIVADRTRQGTEGSASSCLASSSTSTTSTASIPNDKSPPCLPCASYPTCADHHATTSSCGDNSTRSSTTSTGSSSNSSSGSSAASSAAVGSGDLSSILPKQATGRSVKVIVLGGDGFCGWPTALYLSRCGYEVVIVDNLSRRKIDEELGTSSLTNIACIEDRVRTWNKLSCNNASMMRQAGSNRDNKYYQEDNNTEKDRQEKEHMQQTQDKGVRRHNDTEGVCGGPPPLRFVKMDAAKEYRNLRDLLVQEKADAIVHFAEQRAAPYSMKSSATGRYTVDNNITVTHNVLAGMVEASKEINRIKRRNRNIMNVRQGRRKHGYLKADEKEEEDMDRHMKGVGGTDDDRMEHSIHLIHLGTMGVYGYGGGGSVVPSADILQQQKQQKAPKDQTLQKQQQQAHLSQQQVQPLTHIRTDTRISTEQQQQEQQQQQQPLHNNKHKHAKTLHESITCSSPRVPPADTSDIIPEGYINVHLPSGRQTEILHPANPGSVYHMTKCMDALMFQYYGKNYGLRITDLHQGIVWGTNTQETSLDERLINRFDYDSDYGTVLNRFLVQSALGIPLTVYGTGGQTRAFIHIEDTCRCIRLALENSLRQQQAEEQQQGDGCSKVDNDGTRRPDRACGVKKRRVVILNQVAETLRLRDLARLLSKLTSCHVSNIPNPREEADENSLLVSNTKFKQLGWKPILLKESLLQEVRHVAEKYRNRCNPNSILPSSFWNDARAKSYHDAHLATPRVTPPAQS
eukprot:GHVQ01033670.1.p1 GENE.GHVQ01033670.1~~GHVQ01033670.1.p1  ORF type:complete len:992 (+),score=213.75 GHVQ01033670.1:280-3255(+)